MKKITWDAGSKMVSKIDPALSEAMNAFYHNAGTELSSKLFCGVAEYNYGDFIIKNGSCKDDSGEDFDEDFQVSKNLPVGLLLDNCCEVQLDKSKIFADFQCSRTILTKGTFIGLFELLDKIGSVESVFPQSWSITAGSLAITPSVNISTVDSVRKLRREFGDFDEAIIRDEERSFLDKIRNIPVVSESANEWKVKVLYFSKDWFLNLATRLNDSELDYTRAIFLEEIHKRSWNAVTRVRDTGTGMLDLFSSANTRNQAEANAFRHAASLFDFLTDVMTDRRPFWAPSRTFDHIAPTHAICDLLLKELTEDPFALIPRMMSQSETKIGYLPFSPFITKSNSNSKNTIKSVFATMKDVYRNNRDSEESWSVLDLIPKIVLTTKSRTHKATGKKGAQGVCEMFSQSADFNSTNIDFKYEDIDELEFFSPFLERFTTLNEVKCLKYCARIDLNEPKKTY